jgi:hypothetical protein
MFSTAQWPKWIGCAMGAYAAGLIGFWAAIFAGWLAYSGILRQIEEERQKSALREITAKEARHGNHGNRYMPPR